jgi:hypothetical protein
MGCMPCGAGIPYGIGCPYAPGGGAPVIEFLLNVRATRMWPFCFPDFFEMTAISWRSVPVRRTWVERHGGGRERGGRVRGAAVVGVTMCACVVERACVRVCVAMHG